MQWLTRRQRVPQQHEPTTARKTTRVQWLTRRNTRHYDDIVKQDDSCRDETGSFDSEPSVSTDEGVEDPCEIRDKQQAAQVRVKQEVVQVLPVKERNNESSIKYGEQENDHCVSGNESSVIEASPAVASARHATVVIERDLIKEQLRVFFASSASQKAATITANLVHTLALLLRSKAVRRNTAFLLHQISRMLKKETTQWLVCSAIDMTANTVNNDELLNPVSQSLSILAESVLEFGDFHGERKRKLLDRTGTRSSTPPTLSNASKALVQLLGDATVWVSAAAKDERVLEALTSVVYISQLGWHSPHAAYLLATIQSTLVASLPYVRRVAGVGMNVTRKLQDSPTVEVSKQKFTAVATTVGNSKFMSKTQTLVRAQLQAIAESGRTKDVIKGATFAILYALWVLCVGLGTLIIFAEEKSHKLKHLDDGTAVEKVFSLTPPTTEDDAKLKAEELEYLLRTDKKVREEFVRMHLKALRAKPNDPTSQEYAARMLLQVGDVGASHITLVS